MAQPGSVFTVDTAKNYLKNYNKNYLGEQTWLNAFNAIDTTYGQSQSDLSIGLKTQEAANLQDYSSNIAEAYKASLQQKQQVSSSNLGQGIKGQLYSDIDANLDNAYNSYLQNYLANKSTIQQNYLTNKEGLYKSYKAQTNEVDSLLNAEAENVANYLNAHYDYLQAYWDKYSEDNPEIFEQDQFQDYVNREMENGVLTVTGLKDMNAIRDMMFDKDANGDYILNDRGKDFFRQMQQLGIADDTYTFGAYLYENNPELYEWSIGDSQYDTTFSERVAGTDVQGRNTNRAMALGAAGLAKNNVIEDGKWKWTGGTVADNYAKNVKLLETYDGVGETKVDFYDADKGNVGVLSGATVSDVSNEDGGNFTVTLDFMNLDYDLRDEFDLELADEKSEDGSSNIMTDEDVTNLSNAVGGISDKTLYYYDGSIWIAIEENGSFTVRKVQAQYADEDQYELVLKLFERGLSKTPSERIDSKKSKAADVATNNFLKQTYNDVVDFLGVNDIVEHQRKQGEIIWQ